MSHLKIGLILGGPSDERGISLNPARSVADHLEGDGVIIEPIIYFDSHRRPYAIDRKMLYSNTPGDFDFKLTRIAAALSTEELSKALLTCDIVFPVIHGEFGEDGALQEVLEQIGVPYVGSPPDACRVAYDKYLAHELLRDAGLPSVPSVLLSATELEPTGTEEDRKAVQEAAAAVLKPAAGGSSLGIVVLGQSPGSSPGDRIEQIWRTSLRYGRVVLQPFVEGTEFTTVVIEGPNGPVALLPVEVEMRNRTSPEEIFSYRHKYLASDDSRYHCPPREDDEIVQAIRSTAETAFRVLGLRDFARIDCWLDKSRQVLISDVNPISGMEQNSFLFIQAAALGMTHADILRLIVSAACRKSGLQPPVTMWQAADERSGRIPVPVIFGGETAERYVSVLSGTNVWLKLLRSDRYTPVPYLLEDANTVWELPYSIALCHSVEQMVDRCRSAYATVGRRDRLAEDIIDGLSLAPWQRRTGEAMPRRLSMDEFLAEARFVFIALHGGIGEDGTLQGLLDDRHIGYNGSGPNASRLCMDKYETGRAIEDMNVAGISTARKVKVPRAEWLNADSTELWNNLVEECGTSKLMAKPLADGCSSGVVSLANPRELDTYLAASRRGEIRLEGRDFSELADDQIVGLPQRQGDLLFEAVVLVDDVVVDSRSSDGEAANMTWGRERDLGWIEVTVGVLGRRGQMRALNPSLTIARKGVLSVEEKFMGGTGVNITPPPSAPLGRVPASAVTRTRQLISDVADTLGISGYARIDAFMNRDSGDVIVIEANSLPGLTPSTVLYHQALEEAPPVYPRELLETIIELGIEECNMTTTDPTA